MVTVYVPPSPAFPRLHSHPSIMSASPPPTGREATSVFKALGSYADRIRENGEVVPPAAASTSTSTPKPTAAPAAATASASSSSSTVKKASTTKEKPSQSQPAPTAEVEDDGPWETVQSARAKGKQERDRERDADKGSNSRNWRDRPTKDKGGSGSSSKEVGQPGAEGEVKKAPTATASTSNTTTTGKNKRAASSAPATRAASESGKPPATATSTSTSRTTSNAPPVKSAWSIPMKTGTSTPAESASGAQSKGAAARARTAPSSPSLNGTTVANSSVGDISASSPNMSTDTYASTTPPTSAAAKEGDDDSTSWRSRMTPSSVTETPSSNQENATPAVAAAAATPTSTPAAPKAAPPPPTNAWAARQRSLPLPQVGASSEIKPSTSASAAETSKPTGTRLQFGEVSPTMPNGHAQSEEAVKIGGKKKKKDAASVVGGQTVVMDASQWPDVAAAAGSSKAEPKKETKQDVAEQQQHEDASSSSTKKPKWTRVPASELLAAVDEQAAAAAAAAASDANKRQTRKRGSKQGESSTSPVAKTDGLPGKPRKSDGTGAGKRSEIRLPPNPNGQATKSGFKPTFGSVEPAPESDLPAGEAAEAQAGSAINGGMSAPLSRQTSKTSQSAAAPAASPSASDNNKNGPHAIDPNAPLEQSLRLGAGPLKPHAQQNATAPLLQQPFPGAGGGPSLPRPPRGRSSFSGRGGRGGGRGRGGHHDHNNVYAHGYGMGYAAGASGFYGQPQQPMFDPMQAQWYNMQMYGRGPMPPPPQPQTVVPGLNLDPLRFYVLGQIEYYFSMQNLAMDFFLRQQMDTQGWIDIAMIASFNRIKSLTPEVPMVKEMMQVSSLLEVQGDHVRLRGGDFTKWILPDAKKSTLPYTEPLPHASEQLSPSNGHDATSTSDAPDVETTSMVSVATGAGLPDELEVGLDFEDVPADNGPKYQHTPGGVASALMKNASASVSVNGTQGPSSTDSNKPEGEGESTPGTSIVGETDDKAER